MDIGLFNKAYLYLNCGKKSIVIENKYTLNEKIDVDVLRKALKSVIERYHYFKLKPVIDKNGDIDFIINNEEIDVYKLDKKMYQLGSKQTNGYMFRVAIKDNNIYISLSHAIADGRGAISFGLSLIYEYLTLMGITIDTEEKIVKRETKIDETEKDVFKLNKKHKLENYSYEEPFIIPCNNEYFNTEYEKKTVITWEAEKFSELVHKFKCTPVALITAIIGDAICRNYDVKEKRILASIPVDLRPYFKSKAQSNFITSIKIDFKNEYKNLPLEEQVKKIKNNLQEQLNIINFEKNIYETENLFRSLVNQSIKTREDAEELSHKWDKILQTPEFTYSLSNIGVIDIPKQMKCYIKDFEFTTANTTLATMHTLMTIGNVGKLVITQNNSSKTIINEIKNIFFENGIKVEIKDYGKIKMDTILPYNFDYK